MKNNKKLINTRTHAIEYWTKEMRFHNRTFADADTPLGEAIEDILSNGKEYEFRIWRYEDYKKNHNIVYQ